MASLAKEISDKAVNSALTGKLISIQGISSFTDQQSTALFTFSCLSTEHGKSMIYNFVLLLKYVYNVGFIVETFNLFSGEGISKLYTKAQSLVTFRTYVD